MGFPDGSKKGKEVASHLRWGKVFKGQSRLNAEVQGAGQQG